VPVGRPIVLKIDFVALDHGNSGVADQQIKTSKRLSDALGGSATYHPNLAYSLQPGPAPGRPSADNIGRR